MVVQKAVKKYPMVKWFLIVSAILGIAGLIVSKIITDPDNADTTVFLYFLGAAVVLPFLALFFPRREVVTLELPSDSLGAMSKTELEGLLQQLDTAKGKGDMDEARYTNARNRVLSAIKAKGRPAK
jgi:uncharacterized membrane protein YgaE (UPF0421/DUF939 family)